MISLRPTLPIAMTILAACALPARAETLNLYSARHYQTDEAAIVDSVGTALEALPVFLQDGAEKAMQALHTRTDR